MIEFPYTKDIPSTKLYEAMQKVGVTSDVRLKRLRRLINSKNIFAHKRA